MSIKGVVEDAHPVRNKTALHAIGRDFTDYLLFHLLNPSLYLSAVSLVELGNFRVFAGELLGLRDAALEVRCQSRLMPLLAIATAIRLAQQI